MNAEEFYNIIPRSQLLEHIKQQGTPAYISFAKIIKRQVDRVKDCLGPDFHVHYAVKANPFLSILRFLASEGIGADVASAGELSKALEAGFEPTDIEFSGPAKTREELELAIRSGIGAINIENVQELDYIIAIAQRLGCVARVGVRINPITTTKTGLKMAGETQFGLSEADAKSVLNRIRSTSEVEFVGVHIHLGSQILDAQSVLEGFSTVSTVAKWVAEFMGQTPLKLNFGGGWGITYYDKQEHLDLDVIKKGLGAVTDLPHIRASTCIIEPGRFLVAEAGIYVVQVLYTKKAGEKTFLVVDGGMHQNYLLAGGMGQVIRRNFQLDILAADRQPEEKLEENIDIAGCLCTPQDVLARSLSCDFEVLPGDYVVFFNSGAYGISASPVNFLSHDGPTEYLVL